MAGREKVTRKKLDNMGLEELANAGDLTVDMVNGNHELKMSDVDAMTAEQLANLTTNEYNMTIAGMYRLVVYKLLVKSAETVKDLEARQVPASLKYSIEALREIQGDASQHVEKVKRGATAEEMEELLKSLPEAVEAEVKDV